jgi:hypothetical protein
MGCENAKLFLSEPLGFIFVYPASSPAIEGFDEELRWMG